MLLRVRLGNHGPGVRVQPAARQEKRELVDHPAGPEDLGPRAGPNALGGKGEVALGGEVRLILLAPGVVSRAEALLAGREAVLDE